MSDAEGRLAALQARFASRLRNEEAFFRAALDALGDAAVRDETADRAHKLAGIAGSMGFARISQEASALDRMFDGQPPDAEMAVQITALLEQLQAATSGNSKPL